MIIQVTKEAIEYLAQETSIDNETAEEIIRNIITMCIISKTETEVKQRSLFDGTNS